MLCKRITYLLFILGIAVFSQERNIENPIIKPIQQYVDSIEKLGWVSDTLRYNRGFSKSEKVKFKYFNNKPYFSFDSKDEMNLDLSLQGTNMKFDSELFNTAKIVWAYFFRKKDSTYMVSDGIIEQWEFNNVKDSQRALKNLEKVYPFPHINTKPEYFQFENYLIIFSTRAMAFSYDQKPIYDLFGRMLENFSKE